MKKSKMAEQECSESVFILLVIVGIYIAFWVFSFKCIIEFHQEKDDMVILELLY